MSKLDALRLLRRFGRRHGRRYRVRLSVRPHAGAEPSTVLDVTTDELAALLRYAADGHLDAHLYGPGFLTLELTEVAP